MSEELKCPFCGGTTSVAYYHTGNNLLYCHDCKRTFSERDAKIMKQAARIAELEAERDRLQEALQKIAEMEAGSHEPSFEMRGCMTSESCMNCDEMIDIARKALEGEE